MKHKFKFHLHQPVRILDCNDPPKQFGGWVIKRWLENYSEMPRSQVMIEAGIEPVYETELQEVYSVLLLTEDAQVVGRHEFLVDNLEAIT